MSRNILFSIEELSRYKTDFPKQQIYLFEAFHSQILN